jgi:DNA repair exonuclease SbcCD ATPase subunit
LALQKIQKLQTSLKQKEDSNEIYQEQLRALKIASKAKDEELEKYKFENEKLEINNSNLVQECNRLKDDLHQANQRIISYSKAVNLLKENNSKLAEQVDDLSTAQQQHQQQQHLQQQFGGGGGGGGMSHHNVSSHSLYSPEQHANGGNNNNGNNNGNDQAELSNQFNALLSLQRSNAENYKQNASMLNQMSSVSGGASDVGSGGLDLINNSDDKQPNSTDVVCAFLKDHPEIVSKLKNSNQIMYANIITDDKYAAQFLKKMLQSGNDDYRNEISNIVQRLSQ